MLLGCVLGDSSVEDGGGFGEEECVETLAAAAGGSKTFLEGAGVAFGFGTVLARVIHSGVSFLSGTS